MLVTLGNFGEVLEILYAAPTLAIDTETTSLRPFHGGKPFSVIIATAEQSYYFNFNEYAGLNEDLLLTAEHLAQLKALLLQPKTYFFHNARFDMHMLGMCVGGTVHDTKVGARLLRNDHMSYSLANCAKRDIAMEKSDAVEDYIVEHGLWDWVNIPGKKTRDKNKYFDKVPFDIVSEYGLQDGRVTYALGQHQLDAFRTDGMDKLRDVLAMEQELIKVVFHMEQLGVQVDLDYCRAGLEFYSGLTAGREERWLRVTGVPFVDSPACFAQVLPESAKITRTGRVSYDAEALEGMAAGGCAEAEMILDIRDAKKSLDFFNGFLYHADGQGVIHSNLDQAGTKTGRFSSSSPNLQQLTKEEDTAPEFPVRRALVPRDGFFFVMLDFDQQEYRLMLDYAGGYTSDRRLIAQVLAGLDVHQATANTAQISRSQAKTTNFSILFGAGLDLLAARLGMVRQRAGEIKRAVMTAAPEIDYFLRDVTSVARNRGWVQNWMGRRWYLDNPNFAFRAPNFLCQGGGADVVKIAMVRAAKFLENRRSRLVLQLHDELIFEVSKDEPFVVGMLMGIMESIYPHRYLPLTVSVEQSVRSLADKEAWAPS